VPHRLYNRPRKNAAQGAAVIIVAESWIDFIYDLGLVAELGTRVRHLHRFVIFILPS
jgi:hypothetical protein